MLTFSRVKETSITTGTGAYTLDGAQPGYYGFGPAFGVNALAIFTYMAFDLSTGEYEHGVGVLTASNTMTRVAIIDSSNGDDPATAVDWAAGTRTMICSRGGRGERGGIHNFDCLAAPATTDNYTKGYSEGSLWSSKEIEWGSWYCVYGGLPGFADALWVQIGDQNGMRSKLMAGWNQNAHHLNDPAPGFLGNYPGAFAAAGYGAQLNLPYAFVRNAQQASQTYGRTGEAQTVEVGIGGNTTNATPKLIGPDGTSLVEVPQDCIQVISGTMIARNNANGDAKTWTFSITVQRIAAGNVTAVVAASVSSPYGAAGAAAWTLGVAVNTGTQSVDFTATGAAATTILWYGEMKIVHLGLGAAA